MCMWPSKNPWRRCGFLSPQCIARAFDDSSLFFPSHLLFDWNPTATCLFHVSVPFLLLHLLLPEALVPMALKHQRRREEGLEKEKRVFSNSPLIPFQVHGNPVQKFIALHSCTAQKCSPRRRTNKAALITNRSIDQTKLNTGHWTIRRTNRTASVVQCSYFILLFFFLQL